ncbi:lipopolysaccharide biosynthesis protein [Methylobacterium sp. 4-46]|uniref:Wzz/FepE/Etk N-terminal domain-containing protein n=1 Tax=unclassified Methylobacterium TaxID=2615210 RepID=UPI000165C72E|nr:MULTISPECIES: Wzz/FepE/Etk N-terminal domain-containing protein [Methylobacterium]ACA15603.1 lipopolysaccharide biosynthesis protein [Methylobacterium sp. 4-46]WFT83501.1 GNVR domain-containing protein [Methylobacterium nodulans]
MNIKPNQLRLHVDSASPRLERDERWDVAAILDVLRRRRILAACVFVACLTAALAYLATATPLFMATGILVLDTKLTPPSPAQVSAEPTIDPAVVDSQIEILKSRKIATDVVDKLGLQGDPEFVGSGPSLLDALKGRLLSLVEASSGSAEPPDLRQVAAGTLERTLKITRTGRSFLAEINATTRDPKKSAAIANAVAEAYIQDQLSSRMESSQRTTDWMQRRLKEVRDEAEAAERALKEFRAHAGASSPGAEPVSAADIAWERASIEAMRRAAAESLERGRAGLAAAQAMLAALEGGDTAAATRKRLDEVDDPEVSHLAAAMAGPGPSPAEAEALRARLRRLVDDRQAAIGLAQRRDGLLARRLGDLAAGTDPGPNGREQQLARAAEAARSTYEALQNRVSRVSSFLQQQALPVTEARLVSAAVPPLAKSSPRTTLVLLLASAGGLAAGIAAAFLREMFDRRIRWPTQIAGLGQPFLGPLPPTEGRRLPLPGRRARPSAGIPLLIAGPDASPAALETLRAAKIAVDHALGRESCRVVGVVSPCDRDGKSTVAANFAALAAEMRARVLLIDADLHGGGLSAQFAGEGAIGLDEAVGRQHPLARCVVPTPLGFDLLPGSVGAPPAHPVEILASVGLRRLLTEARGRYDYVVIDVPAVLCAVDARAIAEVIDGFILTLASGRTSLDAVERVFATCPGIADRSVGVVLNRSRVAVGPLRARRAPRSGMLEIAR